MNTEPSRIIGFVAFVIVAVATQLLDNGIVTSSASVNALHGLILLTPLIAAEIIRAFVSSPATVAKLQGPPAP